MSRLAVKYIVIDFVHGVNQRFRRGTEDAELKILSGLARVAGLGSLYARRSEPVGDHSVSAPILHGVQTGFSSQGKKLHIKRQMSFNPQVFLCGAYVNEARPVIHGIVHTNDPTLCGTCRRLGIKEKIGS